MWTEHPCTIYFLKHTSINHISARTYDAYCVDISTEKILVKMRLLAETVDELIPWTSPNRDLCHWIY